MVEMTLPMALQIYQVREVLKMRPLVPLAKPLLARGYEEHKKILEALRSGDPERPEEAFQEHNLGMQIQIQKVMREDALKNIKDHQ